MTDYYYAETDDNGVLCVDRIEIDFKREVTEKDVAALAISYPGVIYFAVDREERPRMTSCNGEGLLPRTMGAALPDGTRTGLCVSCQEFHPMYEVIPPSKSEWRREFRLAAHEPRGTVEHPDAGA